MTLPKRTGDLYAPGDNAYEPDTKRPHLTVVDNALTPGRDHRGLSPRCEDDCQLGACVLEGEAAGRWWPDCPTATCPDWKAQALGIAGLDDATQRQQAAQLISELTPEQVRNMAQVAHDAGRPQP
jgi:hypothetical protein